MLKEIIELINKYPNDAELGRKLREWYYQQKVHRIDEWYARNSNHNETLS